MKTNFKPYTGSENDFQKAVARILDYKGCLWTHCANEQKTSMKQNNKGQWYSPTGSLNKAKGKKKGVPDILIFVPSNDYCGFAIELKVNKAKMTPEQQLWMDRLWTCGWKTLCTNSLDEFIFEIDNYLK